MAKGHKDTAPSKAEQAATLRHQAFVHEYIANGFNATQAYLKVFKKEKKTNAAHATAHVLLRHAEVQALLKKELDEAFEASREAMRERLRREMEAIGFSRIGDFMTDGQLDMEKVAKADRGQVKKVLVRESEDKRKGGSSSYSRSVAVEFHDKLKAMEFLAKLLGMISEEERAAPEVHVHFGEHVQKL